MSSAPPVAVSAALTGALTRREHCPAIPYTPAVPEARRLLGL